jgi:hypothetical protein
MSPSDVLFPNRQEDEQEMEMKPVILGPPGYGSPDPATQNATMVAVEDHALDLNPEFGAEVKAASGSAADVEASDGKPSKSASRAEWDEYAVSQGFDPEEYASKEELIEALS